MNPENSNQNELGVSGVAPQVEAMGKGFVAAWLINQETRIESFLENVPDELRSEAHEMLIRLEVYIRASHGESLEQDEFHQRFPDYELEVEQAFRSDSQSAVASQSVSVSISGRTQTSEIGDSTEFEMATRFDVVPEQIGRYKIESVLGTGGFGVVCLARDTELDRLVALKFARTSRFRDKKEMQALIKEARTAAQLEHPGIVAVHDVLVEGELVGIIQQYIEGRDLADELKESIPSFERTAQLLIGICNAIAFAHSKGFVHRDLKPANILLNEKGEPHIADFGLAIHESFQRSRRGDQSGTPRYMSPELVRGESHRVDGRSDIWSIGVMMYRMLTGKRPFAGETRAELFDEIKNREPKPLRQIRSEIPLEFERICLKCLQKPVSNRYATATDIAEDLRFWLQDASISQTDSESESDRCLDVVPKGLRSFDAEDADFFLGLLPGPFARNGLPETIRFWKNRIEQRDSDTLHIGLLYGPSGCGKSSLMKAGLIPNLASFVKAVHIDATGADTEVRLIKALRSRYPEIPTELTLPELFHSLREGVWTTGSDRILIIIDQFEQWLHNRSSYPNTELVEALRHCDGTHVQCLLMVRDDFWLATSRFLKALEVELVEGKNAGLVDLFDKPHARKVLRRYGRGYGRLEEKLTKQESDFIEMAVDELAEEDRVICVRLSLFAEMFKDKSWTPATLRKVGGISGVGVAFLEDTFSSKNASPEHRLYEQAARKILGALLPESTVDIRGNMRSRHELMHLSGYATRPHAFDDVLRILDKELRLITPTDPEGIGSDVETDQGSSKDYYQLTHDYLVAPLRIWLYQKQRETFRGRAQLRLDERHATWSRTKENRFLPSFGEYLNVRTMTRRSAWSRGEREMMKKSDRIRGAQLVVVFGLLLLTGWLGSIWYTGVQADSLAKQVVQAETADVRSIVADIDENDLREPVTGRLLAMDVSDDVRQQLNVDLALSNIPEYRQRLRERITTDTKIENIRFIAAALDPTESEMEELWSILRRPREIPEDEKRLRAATALSRWAASDSRWQDDSYSVADALLSQNTNNAGRWTEAMSSVHEQLFRAFVQHLVEWKLESLHQRDPQDAISLLQEHKASWPEIDQHLDQLINENDPGKIGNDPLANLGEYESLCQKRANAAAILAALGSLEGVLPLLDSRISERTRALLIEQFETFEVDEKILFNSIKTEANPEIRAALWLSLGNYLPPDANAPEEWLRFAKQEFTSHENKLVHSACDWLLRKMNQQAWIESTNLDMAKKEYPPGQSWRMTGEGHTMLRISEPGEFVMSHQRPAKIDYDYEVSALEISWKQWIRHNPDFEQNFQELIGDMNFPDDNDTRAASNIKWFDAAYYCNWLSELEGIDRKQWCYEPVQEAKNDAFGSWFRRPITGKAWYRRPKSTDLMYFTWGGGYSVLWNEVVLWRPQLRLVSDYRNRQGFRLPLESEWEWLELSACNPDWHTGQFVKLFNSREWYEVNSEGDVVPRPGGLKMPGRYGTFDLFGNVIEFCSDPYGSFVQNRNHPRIAPKSAYKDPVEFGKWIPDSLKNDSVKLSMGMPVYRRELDYHRNSGAPTNESIYSGFRVVRILPE